MITIGFLADYPFKIVRFHSLQKLIKFNEMRVSKITIEIYRKRHVFNDYVIDDYSETVFSNVSMIEVTEKHIFGSIDGEQLTIKIDHFNYKYVINP